MADHAARGRDADRSRAAILEAAERLFAAEGHDAASLARIGAAAGLSRQAPAYFFGGKDALYAAVIERLFDAREAALRPTWTALAAVDDEALPAAIRSAVDAYLGFLRDRPAFVAIVEREAVGGAARLRRAPHRSTAMEDGLAGLAARRPVPVDDVLLTVLALGMFWFAHAETFLAPRGVRADDPAALDRHAARITSAVLGLLPASG
ncbi:TetR family transcriptional regulator [Patulibacter brassicae]|uniref:TetR family transcriptional regulator n=1 Tax=Patulibacter brassicae TaxID=1705717 RepID=A0ABU4VP36_9ACTN|nr:TetR family transcriptional regulator [Patulibacter brassicae]MDX8153624.1 TetR family transcriptional regulator [Patulibacter brassicae]